MEEIKLSITLLNYQLQPVVNAKRKQAGWGPSLTPHVRRHVHRGIPLAPPSSTPDTPIQPPSACLPATAPGPAPCFHPHLHSLFSIQKTVILKEQYSVQFSHSVTSESLQPHGLQHARPPYYQLPEFTQTNV